MNVSIFASQVYFQGIESLTVGMVEMIKPNKELQWEERNITKHLKIMPTKRNDNMNGLYPS